MLSRPSSKAVLVTPLLLRQVVRMSAATSTKKVNTMRTIKNCLAAVALALGAAGALVGQTTVGSIAINALTTEPVAAQTLTQTRRQQRMVRRTIRRQQRAVRREVRQQQRQTRRALRQENRAERRTTRHARQDARRDRRRARQDARRDRRRNRGTLIPR